MESLYLKDQFSSTQKRHVVLFVSGPKAFNSFDDSNFSNVLTLSASLRSTYEISCFANNWRKRALELNLLQDLEIKPGHNLYGEKPEIFIVSQENSSYSDVGTAFVEQCAYTIEEYIYKSVDSNILPVVIDIPKESLDLLEAILFSKNFCTQRAFLASSTTHFAG